MSASTGYHVLLLPFALVAVGCSSPDAPGRSNTNPGASCATSKRDQCAEIQQICVADEGGDRCQACGPGEYAQKGTDADTCAPIPGSAQRHDFGTYELEAAQEVDGLCQSWTLGNETEIWVNAVELRTNGGYHHSNWLFAPDTEYAGPDGAWKCRDRGYSELQAAVAGGVLFAQSTQAKRQVQKFQEGVAVRLPPHARIIGGTHLLNYADEPFETTLELAIYTLSEGEVTVPLAPFRLSYLDLTIPPQAVSAFTGECDVATAINGGPGALDMDLYYVMPHYHSLGNAFRLEMYGGKDDGKLLYELGEFDGEAHGAPFDPPVSMKDAKGFRFTCGFENPRNVEVGWGIGDQEMCVMLGFTRADWAFDASVVAGAAAGTKDGVRQFSGACGVLPLEFARGKGELSAMPGN
jgi:hypothetical protein